jgi:hypothetical protein
VKEQPILKRILLACSRGRSRLWRNNVGQLQDARGQWVRYGVANPGGSDLIGWNSVEITPDMVGCRVAIFTAFEVKSAKGRVRPEQQAFIDNVKAAGGIAGVVRSVEEAKSLLTG